MYKPLSKEALASFFTEQLETWEQAANNYKALEGVRTKELIVNGFPFKVQFNPARIVSSAAKVDAKSINERKCFLCEENRPEVQTGLSYNFTGDFGNVMASYTVLINPFPIFPKHLTIPVNEHIPQLISGRVVSMINLAREIEGYTLFYNGPKCGASAPDHFHFQAGNRGFLPIESELPKIGREIIAKSLNTNIYALNEKLNGVIVIESESVDRARDAFEGICALLPVNEGEGEPMLNVLCWYENGIWTIVVFLRKRHRPSHFFAEGNKNILLSPASVDMGGVLITPLEKDFEKIDSVQIAEIFDEVLFSFEETMEIAEKLKKNLKV